MNVTNEALWLHELGFNLLPLLYRSKRPLLSRWKVLQTKRLTREELERLFRPLRNAALITGQTEDTPNVLVLDADTDEAVEFIRNKAPPTPMRCMGARGEKDFFQLPSGLFLKNQTNVCGVEGLDVRSQGGYAAVLGKHPLGMPYRLEGVVPARELPFFPADLIREEPMQKARNGMSSKPLVSKEVASVRKYIQNIFAISGSGGHKSAFRCACRIADAGIEFDDALALMLEWNGSNAQPPFTEKEIHHKITDAFKRK